VTTPGNAGRPRVLHVVDTLAAGGVELTLLRLIERTGERFDHFVCCIRDRGTCVERFEAAGARLAFVGKLPRHDWGVPWRIAKVCRAVRPHIVHTRNWGTIEGAVAARLSRVPVVIHGEHGGDAYNAARPARRDRFRRLVFPFLDRVVVVSRQLERWLLDDLGVSPRQTVLIPNGVDADHFRPRADRDRLRRARGYEPTQVLIGAVGRLRAVKDYPGLLAAFETVRRRQAAARLVIVGDGPEHARLNAEINRRNLRDAVRLAGHQDNVSEWLAAMDLFVQASLMEGTSNALLEAMAVGLPAIATRVGGNPEVVIDGVTGRLVPLDDTAALAAAVEFYIREEAVRRQHGAAGRERVARMYAVASMIDAYTRLYADTLAARRGTVPRP